MSSSLNSLARSAGIILVATVFGHTISLLSEILIARSLSPMVYGQVSLAKTLVLSVGSISLFGVHEGVTRQYSASKATNQKRRIISAGFWTIVTVTLISSSAVFTFRSQISEIVNTSRVGQLLVFFVPYLIIFPLSKLSFSILRGQKNTIHAALAQHIGGKGIATALLCTLVLFGYELSGAIAYWIGYPAVMLAVSIYFINKTSDDWQVASTLPDRNTVKSLWSFSLPLAIGSAVFLLLAQLDILMIGYFLSSVDVGYYRAVQPLKTAAMFALGAFTFFFLPAATEYFEDGDLEKLSELFTISTKWALLITIPLILTLGIFSESVVRVFFGVEFLPSASVLSILVFGLFFRAVSGLDGDMVKAIDRPQVELYSGVVGLLVNFFLNFVLIPRIGINGAAVATVVGYIVYNSMELILIYRTVGASPVSLNIAKVVFSMAAFGLFVAQVAPPQLGLFALLGIGAIFVAVEPVFLVITRSVDQADLELLADVEDKIGIELGTIRKLALRGR